MAVISSVPNRQSRPWAHLRALAGSRSMHAHAGPLSLTTALGLAVLIAARRWAVATWEPLPAGWLVALVVLYAGWLWLLRRHDTQAWGPTPTLVVLLAALATCVPAAPIWHWLAWLAVMAADTVPARRFPLAAHFVTMFAPRTRLNSTVSTPSSADERGTFATHDADPPDAVGDGNTVLQQVLRVRDAQGRQYVYATLRAEFVAGQRHASAVVGFCPPLAEVPAIEADTIDGPLASVKVVEVRHNGVEIEVRLATAAEGDTYVSVELAALPAGD